MMHAVFIPATLAVALVSGWHPRPYVPGNGAHFIGGAGGSIALRESPFFFRQSLIGVSGKMPMAPSRKRDIQPLLDSWEKAGDCLAGNGCLCSTTGRLTNG